MASSLSISRRTIRSALRVLPTCSTASCPADRLRGKLVLIGTSAVGLLDVKTTPIDPVMPGVEVHAQVLESVLTKSLLVNPAYAIGAELIVAVLLGLAIIVAAPMLSATIVVVLGACLIAGLIGLSWYLFAAHSLLIDFTYPLMSSWLIYLVFTFVNYFREQAQRRQIRSAFGQYLSPALVEQLAQSPEKLVLGGEEREMTIMFSDVRGFTTISESYKHDPQGLTTLMNRFLTPLTNAILERKGTIDKYMGDAIMAFWNAPLDDKEHQINACEAALDMLERAQAAQRRARRRPRPKARASSSSMSASASTPGRAWSAIWAPTCASTIPCSATASTWPRGWKARPNLTLCRS